MFVSQDILILYNMVLYIITSKIDYPFSLGRKTYNKNPKYKKESIKAL